MMGTISILVGLAAVLWLIFKGSEVIGWLHAEFESLIGWVIIAGIACVVIFCWIL